MLNPLSLEFLLFLEHPSLWILGVRRGDQSSKTCCKLAGCAAHFVLVSFNEDKGIKSSQCHSLMLGIRYGESL
jgi:hypothetical protein